MTLLDTEKKEVSKISCVSLYQLQEAERGDQGTADRWFTRISCDVFWATIQQGRGRLLWAVLSKRRTICSQEVWLGVYLLLNQNCAHLGGTFPGHQQFHQCTGGICGQAWEPKDIWSDHRTNFVGAQQELQHAIQEWNQGKIHKHLLKKGVIGDSTPPEPPIQEGIGKDKSIPSELC